MKIACFVTPALGHWHPVASVLTAATEEGHEVRVFAAESFLSTVADAGFHGTPCGVDWTGGTSERTLPSLSRARTTLDHLRVFFELLAPPMFHDGLTHCREWSPDAIVHDAFEFAGPLLGELLGCPSLSVGVTPRLPSGVLAYYGGALQRQLRSQVGVAQGHRKNPSWYVDICPPSLKPRALHSRLDEITCGASAWRGGTPGDASAIDLLRQFRCQEEPLVHLTFGTVSNVRYSNELAAFAEALVRLPINLIVTGLESAALKPRENLLVRPYISHGFLDACDLVVCHAGYGTVIGSLLAGVPLCLLPIKPDQALTAYLCTARGVAQTVANDHWDLLDYCIPDKLCPADLCTVVGRMLQDPGRFRSAAHEVRAEMLQLPPLLTAVHTLEEAA